MSAKVRASIDAASARYARAWSAAQEAVVKIVEGLLAAGKTADEIVTVLGSLDFNTLGMTAEAAKVQAAFGTVLAKTVARNTLNATTLEALARTTTDTFLAEANAYPAKLKAELIKSILGGQNPTQMRASLAKTLPARHAETLANTSLNTFSRTVQDQMSRQDPPDTLYAYEGPQDNRTRDICAVMGNAGPMTRADIDATFPGAFTDGGGFNCRHSWEPAAAAVEVDRKAAAEQVARRRENPNWREPQTVRQQIEAAA